MCATAEIWEACWHVSRPELHARSRNVIRVTEVGICTIEFNVKSPLTFQLHALTSHELTWREDSVFPAWGVFPVSWSSRLSWSLHLFLGRAMFLRPFGWYCSAYFGIPFVSILCNLSSSKGRNVTHVTYVKCFHSGQIYCSVCVSFEVEYQDRVLNYPVSNPERAFCSYSL